ncbi:MAG: efflux RND transporter periplasmic adaptor subunit [Cyanobacteriota bacterium]|nr:efflux RND transporter periplasmic adaptor subunit [Cyanobacteriota bacterium]
MSTTNSAIACLDRETQQECYVKKREGLWASRMKQPRLSALIGITLLGLNLLGCAAGSGGQPETQGSPGEGGPIAADVAIAREDALTEAVEYTGTTRPIEEVSLRSQAEGRLLNLKVDIGDRVTQGQVLAQIDDTLLQSQVRQAKAELATLESELARARALLSEAQTQLQRTQVEREQAQNDAGRYTQLARSGAVSQQEAESFQTAARVANQAVLSAREQVKSQQKAVESAMGQIAAQRAAVAQQQERLAYAQLTSPINGVVLEKVSEPGNLVSPGGEILKLGNLSRLKIVVPVSELDLSDIQEEQSVGVSLDALPQQNFSGTISRISPLADATTRQVPVEVTLPNPNGSIGSGLLARVRFQGQQQQRVVIPQGAVGESEEDNSLVFVVEEEGDRSLVEARTVTVGDRGEGKVEILSGLTAGERFVVKSSRPLKDGDVVRESILSE